MDESNVLKFLATRQSTRAYTNQAVEIEKLNRCLEAARLAPSACNSQPWHFVVVDNPELKNQVADYAASGRIVPMNHFTRQAPILIVLVREEPNLKSRIGSIIKDKPYTMLDVGIVALQFCLQAHAEGLGTCMMGWFDEKKVKKLLNIPRSKRAELIIALGYSAQELRPKVRKDIKEIHSFNTYR